MASDSSYLEFDDNGKKLKVVIEFVERKKVGTKSDLLKRALGRKGTQRLFVVDATAGLCRDSMHLLALGCDVVAIERNELLFQGFRQLPQPENFKLIHADATDWLAKCASSTDDTFKPDIVYLDPMFPEKKKSAAVSKETRLLQILEQPPSANEESDLLRVALGAAASRVIVKRPLHAHWLAKQKPSHEYIGKAVRYDVYVVSKR